MPELRIQPAGPDDQVCTVLLHYGALSVPLALPIDTNGLSWIGFFQRDIPAARKNKIGRYVHEENVALPAEPGYFSRSCCIYRKSSFCFFFGPVYRRISGAIDYERWFKSIQGIAQSCLVANICLCRRQVMHIKFCEPDGFGS